MKQMEWKEAQLRALKGVPSAAQRWADGWLRSSMFRM